MAKPSKGRGYAPQPGKKTAALDAVTHQLFLQGLSLHRAGDLSQAKAIYEAILEKRPEHVDALHLLGVVFKQSGHLAAAEQLINRAISIRPDYAEALNNLANVLVDMQRADEALSCYDRAIAIKPAYADAFNNRGNALMALQRIGDALESFERAIAIKPNYAEALNNRGNALSKLKQPAEALASFDQAIAVKPDYAEAINNRGTVLLTLKRNTEALASFNHAIAIRPDSADALNNLGNALMELHRPDQALAAFERAIHIKPDYAEAHYNRGLTLAELKRTEDALASYEKALALRPDYAFLFGRKLHTQLQLCDWDHLPGQLERLQLAITEGRKVSPPFSTLGVIDSPVLHLKAAKIYTDAKYAGPQLPAYFDNSRSEGKIRVAYYSSDFYSHATSYLMAELLESHDKNRFEVYAFSFGPNQKDPMRHRIAAACDEFLDVSHLSDHEVAMLSRARGIDIAVDLKGFTKDSRTGIFEKRCAPLQVNYLGYPGTMAAPWIDYIIADRTLIPEDCQRHYTEKVVYLPHSYQPNDSRRQISDKVFTRLEAGLPDSGFVFCCFNNNYKILPATFDGWMRLLRAIDGSVLWLLEDNPAAAQHLRKEAALRSVHPDRLVFAKRMDLPDHLARHRLADLFIDTLPYNAHTTASDALWAGLPVLTQIGESFAARVTASLLSAVGLPEMITHTREDYEATAIRLATHPEMLSHIRSKLHTNRLTSPLFKGRLFARHIEAAFSAMYQRYRSGLPPDHIHIRPDNE